MSVSVKLKPNVLLKRAVTCLADCECSECKHRSTCIEIYFRKLRGYEKVKGIRKKVRESNFSKTLF